MSGLARAVLLALAIATGSCGSEEESPSAEPRPADPAPAPPAEELSVGAANAAAQQAYDAGDHARAAELFGQALAAEPDNSTALLGRAWAFLMAARARAEARERIADDDAGKVMGAFDAIESDALGQNAWKVRLGQGLLHLLLGDDAARDCRVDAATAAYARAEEFLEPLQRSRPGWNNVLALDGLARIAQFRGDHDAVVAYSGKHLEQIARSVRLWRDALERFPQDMETWAGKLAEALPMCRPALTLRTESLLALGRTDEAKSEAAKLLEIGRELEILEHPSDAKAAYDAFLLCAKRLGLPKHHEGVNEARKRVRELGR